MRAHVHECMSQVGCQASVLQHAVAQWHTALQNVLHSFRFLSSTLSMCPGEHRSQEAIGYQSQISSLEFPICLRMRQARKSTLSMHRGDDASLRLHLTIIPGHSYALA